MRDEKQFFRLVTLTSVVSFIACLTYSLYCQDQANDFHDIWLRLYDTFRQESNCARTPAGCSLAHQIQEQLVVYGNHQDHYLARANTFSMLSWLIPLISYSLFYSARWIRTGTLFRRGGNLDSKKPLAFSRMSSKTIGLHNPYLAIYLVALLGVIIFDCASGEFGLSILSFAGYIGGAIGISLMPWLVLRFGTPLAGFITLAFVLVAVAQSKFHLFGVVA